MSQTLELSEPMLCHKAAHEPCEHVRVEKGCRRLFLNPGELRWLNYLFVVLHIWITKPRITMPRDYSSARLSNDGISSDPVSA